MQKLKQDGEVIGVYLESQDTLGDMAQVSGYTIDKLAKKIEAIIDQSIWDEVNRDAEEEKDGDTK